MSERWISFFFDVGKGLAVAAVTALVAFVFTKRNFSKLMLASRIRSIGVKTFRMDRPTDDAWARMFRDAEKVQILFVNGTTFFKNLSKVIYKAALSGTKFEILIATKGSQFVYEIENMEKAARCRDKSTYLEHEFNHLENEVFPKLLEKLGNSKCPEARNNICIKHFDREYRLPLVLVYPKEKRRADKMPVRGFLYLSLPPYQTRQFSTILELYADEVSDQDMVYMVRKHFDAIWERENPRDYWTRKDEEAKQAKEERAATCNGTLIEIAAQHPLDDGERPGAEFRARLDAGIELYEKLKAQNLRVQIYVPGSLHIGDKVSLSEAGKAYLIEHKVDPKDIYGEERADEYKERDGVYNSADECFVASRIYFDEAYQDLVSVCSATQFFRKKFLYLEFGIAADCLPVAENDRAHNIVNEFFGSLSAVIYSDDHSWKTNGYFYNQSRKERKENYVPGKIED